jgi:uncharacterized protein (DUF1800 family)
MTATPLPPLSTVDPTKAWQPWEPDDKQPWNLKWAGHLYRRAGFGANLAELRESVKSGHAATLDRLLDADAAKDKDFMDVLNDAGRKLAGQRNSYRLRGWWLYAMFYTPASLREKMTLFWHNHFATSNAKVQSPVLMQQQNQLLRTHALGKFGTLLVEISKDPAMLVYLDSNSNVQGKPNENYAREVMELFSLGVGNYTETDIREAARAFTGWHTDDDKFDFVAKLHDTGEKTVLKETGNWNGDDIVRILLAQDACARFLVHKLYRAFISETQEPPKEFLEPLCAQLRKSDYDIGALVKTMLRSRHFFSDYAYRQRIKSPVEFAVGAIMEATDRPVPVAPVVLAGQLEPMGQQLFAPPNVKGWPGGKAWLSTSTLLARHNFAQKVAGGTLKVNPFAGLYADDDLRNQFEQRGPEEGDEDTSLTIGEAEKKPIPGSGSGSEGSGSGARPKREDPPADPKLDVARIVKKEKVTDHDKIADLLLDWFLQGGVSASARTKLIDYLAKDSPKDVALERRIRAATHAVMTMPEYQLA